MILKLTNISASLLEDSWIWLAVLFLQNWFNNWVLHKKKRKKTDGFIALYNSIRNQFILCLRFVHKLHIIKNIYF